MPEPTAESDRLLSFSLRPECPKCGGITFDWDHTPSGFHYLGSKGRCPVTISDDGRKGEHLDVMCLRCGFTMGMRTKDYRKPS